MLVEDEKRVNKLEDALNTFTEVCQSKLLENCDFALFLKYAPRLYCTSIS